MKFDWKRFCDDYGIPYVTKGPSTTRGNISIKCVWCGQSDPSEHLGLKLDLKNPAWNCWRNAEHHGRAPRRLVQKLLGCSFEAAQEIINNQLDTSPEDTELESATDALRTIRNEPLDESPTISHHDIQLLSEFKPLHRHMRHAHYADMFLDYLSRERGFGKDAATVAEEFKLYYTVSGEFAWRLIIPFYVEGNLLGWTGRNIRNGTRHRYHSRGSKDLIFNVDKAMASKGNTLIIVEGPLDAIKMHYYGSHAGYAVVATLGVAITPIQIEQLSRLIQHFEIAIVLFDRDMLAAGLPVAAELEALSGRMVRAQFLSQYKDPGEVPPEAIPQLCEALSHF